MNIVEQGYWDNGYQNYTFIPLPEEHPVVNLIYCHIQKGSSDKSVLEIGCYPGHILFHFGKLGYKLNGIDLTQDVYKISEFFAPYKFEMGEFKNADINSISSNPNYDIVCSFGFIEHFTNFDEIIKKHCDLLKPNGYLILTTPNFSYGLRYLYQILLDKKNFKRHILKAMRPNEWEKHLSSDIQIIDKGFCGEFFWKEKMNESLFEKVFSRIIPILAKLIRIFSKNSKHTSSYSYLIAKKNG